MNMNPENLQKKTHILIKQYIQSAIIKKTYLNQFIIQRELESINLSAINSYKIKPKFWRNQEIPEKFWKRYEQVESDLFQNFYICIWSR